MSAALFEIGLSPSPEARASRREARERRVRLVECSAFPRRRAAERPCLGHTRDISRSGLCVCLDRAPAPGGLLRVRVRDVDGIALHESVARVVWSHEDAGGRGAMLGLELVPGARREPLRAGLGRTASPIACSA